MIKLLLKMKISAALARRLVINSQLLDGRQRLPKGKERVSLTYEKLGYVQIDTISVINRAHHHTLWTRLPHYQPEMLHQLHAKDRKVFEYWGHAASYLPMKDYRYYLPRMRSFPEGWSYWTRQMHDKSKHVMKVVMERIRNEGALASRDFKAEEGRKRGQWWDWKPAKMALEMLLWKGDLMVSERRNFQRVYDLTERVLPEGVDTTLPHVDEVARFQIRRALSSHAIATQRDIAAYLHVCAKQKIGPALTELVDAGQALGVKIEGSDDTDYYALKETLETSARLRKLKPRIHLLSPFDNMIINRNRVKRLFGFEYTLECYTPPAKRKYGYFVLPVLWGNELVAKLDPKADRKQGTLIVRRLIFEKNFKDYDGIMAPLADKLKALAEFNNCASIELEQITPAGLKPALNKSLS